MADAGCRPPGQAPAGDTRRPRRRGATPVRGRADARRPGPGTRPRPMPPHGVPSAISSSGRDEVAPPELDRVHVQAKCELVDQLLERERRLRSRRAPGRRRSRTDWSRPRRRRPRGRPSGTARWSGPRRCPRCSLSAKAPVSHRKPRLRGRAADRRWSLRARTSRIVAGAGLRHAEVLVPGQLDADRPAEGQGSRQRRADRRSRYLPPNAPPSVAPVTRTAGHRPTEQASQLRARVERALRRRW